MSVCDSGYVAVPRAMWGMFSDLLEDSRGSAPPLMVLVSSSIAGESVTVCGAVHGFVVGSDGRFKLRVSFGDASSVVVVPAEAVTDWCYRS